MSAIVRAVTLAFATVSVFPGAEFYFLSAHPRLRSNIQKPILQAGNSSQILSYMLLTDIPHRNQFAVAIWDVDSKLPLRRENSLGVMPESPMPEISYVSLWFIKPVVNGNVVFWFTTKLADRWFGVFPGMCH
jgi:hypothetical protein